jgi:hypothetical protein
MGYNSNSAYLRWLVMKIGFRVYFFKDDDSFQRITMATFDRLLRGDSQEKFPELSGTRIRCALVVLNMAGKIPLSIMKIDYSYLSFNSEGRISSVEMKREYDTAMKAKLPFTYERKDPITINLSRHFAQQQCENIYSWYPSHNIEKAVMIDIFDNENHYHSS